DHHREVVDQTLLVEVQEVASGDLAARHGRLKHERMVAAVAVMDLAAVVEVLEDPQDAAEDGRGDRLSDIRLESHRACEHHVVGPDRRNARLVALLDRPTESMLSTHQTPRIVNLLSRCD